jgi:hypothetical protein
MKAKTRAWLVRQREKLSMCARAGAPMPDVCGVTDHPEEMAMLARLANHYGLSEVEMLGIYVDKALDEKA